jgi:hypothetical protein
MPLKEVAEKLLELYFIRRDAYGISTEKGLQTVKEPVTLDLIMRHLSGEFEIGAHCIEPSQSTCKWIAWDIDRREVAVKLWRKVTDIFPKEACLFEQTSGRGYHILVFWKAPVYSEICYNIARRLSEDLEGVETFPRQPWINPDGYGNWIRLPLGRRGEHWSRLLHPERILDVKPTLPGEHLNLNEYKMQIPFWLKANRCPHRLQDQSKEWSCLRDDGSIGLCSALTCPLPLDISPHRPSKDRVCTVCGKPILRNLYVDEEGNLYHYGCYTSKKSREKTSFTL